MIELVFEGHVFDDELLHVLAEVLVFRVELIDCMVIAAPFKHREDIVVCVR
jgi:hypothetical protein